jgi:hypothetical protein
VAYYEVIYSDNEAMIFWYIKENFEDFMFVVMRDKKNILHTISRIRDFCESVRPLYGKGDLLPSMGVDNGSADLELMQMMMRIHEIVEIMPIRVR